MVNDLRVHKELNVSDREACITQYSVHTRLADPFQVRFGLSVNDQLFAQLQKIATTFNSLSLFGEFSEKRKWFTDQAGYIYYQEILK